MRFGKFITNDMDEELDPKIVEQLQKEAEDTSD